MRNKGFILLLLVYILTFGLILDINGVFSGDAAVNTNLIINVTFLGIIGILFIISIFSFIRLNLLGAALIKAAKEIERQFEPDRKNLWPDYRKKQEPFGNARLNGSFARYQKHVAINADKKGNPAGQSPRGQGIRLQEEIKGRRQKQKVTHRKPVLQEIKAVPEKAPGEECVQKMHGEPNSRAG